MTAGNGKQRKPKANKPAEVAKKKVVKKTKKYA